MLYQNKNYSVTLDNGDTKYKVVNNTTAVVEYESESLPRCIIVAQESDGALERYIPKELPVVESANVVSLFE